MPRIITIKGGKQSQRGVARATTKAGSKVDKRVQSTPLQWLYSGKWAGVISSNVKAIKYDRPAMRLYVRFKDGSVYFYPSTTWQTARAMFNCPSMGKFVWRIRRAGIVGVKV